MKFHMIGKREVKVSNKDPNYVIKIEQAIAKKYGEETVENPRGRWDEEKEKEYLSGLKETYVREAEDDQDKVEVNGVFVPRKLFKEKSSRTCPVCETYSFKSADDVYMTKFSCCYKCYIQYVEHREERWKNGWRPNL